MTELVEFPKRRMCRLKLSRLSVYKNHMRANRRVPAG